MCGRFTLRTPTNALVEQFGLKAQVQLPLRYNIAPTQEVAAIRILSEVGTRQLDMLRWGLIPPWAKDPTIGGRMINARRETVSTKPSFRSAFKHRRCLVTTDGYYEWKKLGGRKQPYYIRMQDERPFAFAGLWETWRGGPADSMETPLVTCTIITTEANELSRPIHHRMPVILEPDHYDVWLDLELDRPEPLQSLLVPYRSEEMVAVAVTTYVNRPSNDDPKCIKAQEA